MDTATETPDQRAARFITEQPHEATNFPLVVGGQHNVPLYEVPWPDEQGTLHKTYFVKNGKSAVHMPGENKIRVSFDAVSPREFEHVVQEFKMKCQAQLAKASVNKAMTTMEEYKDKLMEHKTHRGTVSRPFHCLLRPSSLACSIELNHFCACLFAGVWLH